MKYVPQRRTNDGFGKNVLRFFKWLLIVTGGAVVAGGLFAFLLFGGSLRHHISSSAPGKTVLTYTLQSALPESAESGGLSLPLLKANRLTYADVIRALTYAAHDKRIRSLVVRLRDPELSPAQLQGLRVAIEQFRAGGKQAYIYAVDYGGSGSGIGDYYLASSFGQIWLQPVGTVSMNGIAAEVPFFKDILDKIGVSAQFQREGIYKSMPESVTLNGMSAPARQMMVGMVNDLSKQIVAGIADGRKMKVDRVNALVDNSPYTDGQALKLKLIDKIGYYDDMLAAAMKAAGKGANRAKLEKYAASLHSGSTFDDGKKIALIVGEGDIVSYGGQPHLGFDGGMAADKLVKVFRMVRADKHIVAVVFRINSPGGSPEAAETIRHAMLETEKSGKPVIVSMGGYAASGGYWIASAANKIVAEPATITGSIGVFGGKFVLAGLWNKLGVHWGSVTAGKNAMMWSQNVPFTPKQTAQFQDMLANIYRSFITRVATGRDMKPAAVEAVAQGHVWTGEQAQKRGLVDVLGGINKAVALAREMAHLKAGEKAPLVLYPRPKTPMQRVIELISGKETVAVLPALQAADILHALQTATGGETGLLQMPEMQLH